MRIEYQDPHNAAPEPDHLFPLMFGALYGRLSVGGHVPTREYPPARARELFGADWAAAAVFDVDPEFARGYRQGLLLALHGARRGDAYVVFLFDDYAEVRERIQADLARLRFSPEADADSG